MRKLSTCLLQIVLIIFSAIDTVQIYTYLWLCSKTLNLYYGKKSKQTWQMKARSKTTWALPVGKTNVNFLTLFNDNGFLSGTFNTDGLSRCSSA